MGFLNDTGHFVQTSVQGAGFTLDLFLKSIVQTVALPRKIRATVDQMFVTGVKTIPVVSIVAVFAGMILSMQTGLELQRLGQQDMIGTIVAISMTREMAPFITGLILAATVGSAMAAELGTMAVSEEIMALEVMSIDPVRYLVMPRVVALSIMCPILAAFACIVGIVGGAIVAQAHLGVSMSFFYSSVYDTLYSPTVAFPKDLWVGLIKGVVFGATIATIGCSTGIRASGGALGVGRAVQQAVKNSVVLIIIMGYIITWFFFIYLGREK